MDLGDTNSAHRKGLRQGSVGGPDGGNSPELNLKEVFARVVEVGEEGRGTCRQTGCRVGRGGQGRAGARLTTPRLRSPAPGPACGPREHSWWPGRVARSCWLPQHSARLLLGCLCPHEPHGSGSQAPSTRSCVQTFSVGGETTFSVAPRLAPPCRGHAPVVTLSLPHTSRGCAVAACGSHLPAPLRAPHMEVWGPRRSPSPQPSPLPLLPRLPALRSPEVGFQRAQRW